MRLSSQIEDYEMDEVILDLASEMNVLTKQTWEAQVKLLSYSVEVSQSTKSMSLGETVKHACGYRWCAKLSRL